MRIAHAGQEDLEKILELQRIAYQSEAKLYNDYTIAPLMQTLEQLREEWERSVILKAEMDGKIIGSVRAFEENSTCHIGRLMVHPDEQNRGIGKQLVKAIEECFDGLRYELFTGHISSKNLAFYEKLGYKQFKTVVVSDAVQLIYLEKQQRA